MEDHSNSVMIALLPITKDWCLIDVPHMTLVYAGETTDLNKTVHNEIAKDAASLAAISRRIYTRVIGVEVFGPPGDEVNVLKLQNTPELFAMRSLVERWNASEFPFNPHATIGPVDEPVPYVPQSLAFDRLLVGWGKEYLTFWLAQ